WGSLPAAGVVTGITNVSGQPCMIVANDATVKAGAMFPQSIKKVLRAQRIAFQCRLPLIYLVDSSGVFLPLQDEIFPDEDDFGRIFRNNSVLSAAGIPQFAAVMGNCIAGGAYLPVLCDKLLMTEGSGLYLAGPALVKAAIGQEADPEELGGAKMHAEISGTVDFHEPDDAACIQRLRSLVDKLPHKHPPLVPPEGTLTSAEADAETVYKLVGATCQKGYDAHDLLKALVDEGSLDEYKATYGQTLVTAYAKIGGRPVGIVANQRIQVQSAKTGIEIGGVIYAESADKAARFIMDCNQMEIPLLFLQDVSGFMVGKQAEQSGIIRCGAKLVNALSNCIVPKITVVVGNSFGAGNYALCGKAYDPTFILAWPNARYAVMGADQAADTLFQIQKSAAERKGEKMDEAQAKAMRDAIAERYREQMDIRYGAARGWVDGIIAPDETREILINLLRVVGNRPRSGDQFHTGVLQV
ncbi:MAG: acyl-CoA carboxylase subunit beta, partial [Chlamydiia bacterium]|nr:acyl-CoA carboxylase subunit beta [Chlamydiia bacterium]